MEAVRFGDEDVLAMRRLGVCRLVHETWTAQRSDDAMLAIPFFDGRAELLLEYVSGDAPAQYMAT